ncbi:SPRY domain-containing protein 3-like isoform X3 [Penaeus japonicus]|uniref:SPRY domain-containing protein 3-like isoform X3 n=1 Tax=Penaeus japonicus TaxID=27405 RepID=UPI001C70B1B5|nr:SPRY domain-containing protein 3-like isoform X3 [Penaeus japonicus]
MLSCVHPNLFVLFKKLFGAAPAGDSESEADMYNNFGPQWPFVRQRHPASAQGLDQKVRAERITIEGDVLSYSEEEEEERVGVYVGEMPVSADRCYFEIEILDMGVQGAISIGLCSAKYPLHKLPGWAADSVGYHADDGRLYKARPRGVVFGPRCGAGDRMGCGIKFEQISPENDPSSVPVFFTKNGKEVGSVMVRVPPGGLYPCVGLAAAGDAVRLSPQLLWPPDEDTHMSVDSMEEEWLRLHDIRLNGQQMLEYCGRGKSLVDVGLAQARTPLNTTSHYFEMEIVDPGRSGYITIGLTKKVKPKEYPKNRHPGWNRGSIAYHADDGRVFAGSTVGSLFGPRCQKGDVMGCGIIFPRDYVCNYDSEGGSMEEESPEPLECEDLLEHLLQYPQPGLPPDFSPQYPRLHQHHHHNHILTTDSEEDEDDDDDEEEEEEDDSLEPSRHHPIGGKVQVFFTRNGQMIGRREVALPKGGFFPSISMGSLDERVRVDLRPLTG